MANTTTKAERERRLEYAKALLIEKGFEPSSTSALAIVPDLMREFGIVDRRTARQLAARAAADLQGTPIVKKVGRPRKWQRVPVDREG